MPKRSSTADANELAAAIVAFTTAGGPAVKNPAAVALGRLGGIKGGPARAKALSSKQKSVIAKRAARARWKKRIR
jgi:hypothetical protein